MNRNITIAILIVILLSIFFSRNLYNERFQDLNNLGVDTE